MHFWVAQLALSGEHNTYFKYFRSDPDLKMHLCLRKKLSYLTFTNHCSVEKGKKQWSGCSGTKSALSQTDNISQTQKTTIQSLSPFGVAEVPHRQGHLCNREGCPHYWPVILATSQYPSFPTPCFIYFRCDSSGNLSHTKLLLLGRKQRHTLFFSRWWAWQKSWSCGLGAPELEEVEEVIRWEGQKRPPISAGRQAYVIISPTGNHTDWP